MFEVEGYGSDDGEEGETFVHFFPTDRVDKQTQTYGDVKWDGYDLVGEERLELFLAKATGQDLGWESGNTHMDICIHSISLDNRPVIMFTCFLILNSKFEEIFSISLIVVIYI